MVVDKISIPGYTIPKEPQRCASELRTCHSIPHPLDQLSIHEIPQAAALIQAHVLPMQLKFNSIALREPTKISRKAFQVGAGPRPDRRALVIAIEIGTSNVSQGVVNLTSMQVEEWKQLKDVMPILTLEDLDVTERIARKDARVINACGEIGINNMSKVFFDAWAIGFDERWGYETRLQQGLAYYRNCDNDNQYAHPLDFSVVVDTEKEEVLSVDIRRVNGERTPVSLEEHNYHPQARSYPYKLDRLQPINITQPQGVSFSMSGNELSWAGLRMHVGFNYREGIVISDVRVDDPYENRDRSLFNRISVVEMVVPYGCPLPPHHKKHAFDVGEYGTGLMTNSLKLGCDCKGAIYYLDGVVSTARGEAAVIENAICIHEEDNGLLYKHTDFRDGTVVSAKDRKLIISQIITAANYEYCFYHTFQLDGTYKLEVKLTGILNTYPLHSAEEAQPYGTEISKKITAHNHQHIFSLRINPEVDGPNNTVIQSDAVASQQSVGSPENQYGNAFYSKSTPLKTSKKGATNYCHETSRTWDIVNPNILHPIAKKPVSYKIISRESPPLLAKPGSIVWKRAGFSQKSLWVTPFRDYELFPAGNYVCQSTGQAGSLDTETIVDWAERDEPIENTDIVCYLQFGLTHFLRTEDFPIMPAEPVSIMLRATNFFLRNPALWVAPSDVCCDSSSQNTPSIDISRQSDNLGDLIV